LLKVAENKEAAIYGPFGLIHVVAIFPDNDKSEIHKDLKLVQKPNNQ